MSDIRGWLEELGLGQYGDAFEANAITLDYVRDLTDADLEKLGVAVMGHRKALLRAIEALAAPPRAAESVADRADGEAAREAERRQITVMFCDLVGSTALSHELDPEDLREVMRGYQDACAGAIARFEGHIAQTLGDGLMVYFGYPIAHEDDAQRAVRAGLDIVGAIAELSARLESERGVMVAVRVGVHTGLVVAGEVGGADTRGDMAVVGETPNIAARIEGLADPGTVVVGDRTRRLVGDVFDFDDLGPHDLKGLSVPMALYRATAERAADSRFEAMHPAGLTPFVGRDEEISLLMARWRSAQAGEGQVVLLEGEPGIGKSRITGTARELIAADSHIRLQYQCSPFYTSSAFYPLISHLERAAKFDADDDTETKTDKLEQLIGNGDTESLALFAALLSLDTARYPPLNMSPQRQKERTIEVMVGEVAKLARDKPVLMVFEDVHWVDPTSLETLDQMIAAIDRLPVLLVITFRPEFAPQWGAHAHITAVSLNRLGRPQSAVLVDKVTEPKRLPGELRDQIVTKTDGVPLFIEELTKAVVESDIVTDQGDRYALSGAVDSLAIPDTLHDSLMARLDKLIPVKEVAQIGAAIGREFSYQLIAALSPMAVPELDAALDKLVGSELVHRRGTPPEATYTFKHALVQDAAYDSLLKRDRQDLHKQIADVLLGNFPDIAATEPELLAHHYTQAGLIDKAVPNWLAAGQMALARASTDDSAEHLRSGLALIDEMPESKQRHSFELQLYSTLGLSISAGSGYGNHEVASVYAKAENSLEDSELGPEICPTLYGMGYYYWVSGDTHKGLAKLEQMLDIARRFGDDDAALVAYSAISCISLNRADNSRAIEFSEIVLDRYDPERHGARAAVGRAG